GLLSAVRRQNIPITVKLPSTLPKYSACPRHKFWNFFLNSIHGVILANYCSRILDAQQIDRYKQIIETQSNIIAENGGLVHSGKHVAAPVWDTFGHPTPATFLQSDDIHRFYGALKALLFQHLGLKHGRDIPITRICEFAYEAFQNACQHGSLG